MKINNKPQVVHYCFKQKTNGDYVIVLSFDTGIFEEFYVVQSIVDTKKLIFE